MRFSVIGAFLLFFAGCVRLIDPEAGLYGVYSCDDIEKHLSFRRPTQALNLISKAYRSECHDRVIKYGHKALGKYRYKTHFWSKEVASIFVPEELMTGYVLESYERAYLSFLISASYLKAKEIEESQVELRRMDEELRALLYTRGEDPVNILLQAIMWEKHGDGEESWVDWSRLRDSDQATPSIRSFAARRADEIDAHPNSVPEWSIYAFGRFPSVGWDLQFGHPKKGYFRFWPIQGFSDDCASTTGIRLSTKSWFKKIERRHQHRYHPLLNAKSWIRLPIGVAYSLAALTPGAMVIVGSCAVADAAILDEGSVCDVTLKGGLVDRIAPNEVLRETLKPDLRHWENLPEGFLVTTRGDFAQEECYLPARGIWRIL